VTPIAEAGGHRGRGRWARVLALGLVALVVATAVADMLTVRAEHRARADLTATRRSLRSVDRQLRTTGAATDAAWSLFAARQAAQDTTESDTYDTGVSLGDTDQSLQLEKRNIATLRACLDGVSTAESAVAASDQEGAVLSLTDASSACRSLEGTSTGLSYAFDFPDPFVLTVGGEYYAFSTNSVAGNIQVIESSDLDTWTTLGDALPTVASWASSGATWGPSVLQVGSSFVLYYSTTFGTSGDECISEALASQPQGPYVDSSTAPLECQVALGGSIDPSPVVAADGTPYLTWKSEGAAGQPPTVWSQQLTPTGTALVPGAPSTLLTPSQSWQGGIVEGPDMVLSGGRYLLLYSANNWQTADYAIGAASCTGPLGPCTPIGTTPLLASGSTYLGPGGPSVFTDAHGVTWLAFHAWLPGKVGFPNNRDLFLRQLSVVGGLPELGS
jgi:hypothetical protein